MVGENDPKMQRAVQAYAAGRFHDSVRILKDIVSETRNDELKYMAAREITVILAKIATERGEDAYLEIGTRENAELQRYMDIAIRLYPSLSRSAQREMPIETVNAAKQLFSSQERTRDSVHHVVEQLMALKRELGADKITIPKDREKGLEFTRKFGYILKHEFAASDPTIVSKVRQLALLHKDLVVIPDFDKLTYTVYASPGFGSSASTSSSVSGSSGGGGILAFVILAVIAVVCVSVVWNGITARSNAGTSTTTTSGPRFARVTKSRVNMRPEPNEQNRPVRTVEKNETLELLSPNYSGKGWYNVRHAASSTTGWIHGNNIELVY